jgi:Family of unknown function (DUF6502)
MEQPGMIIHEKSRRRSRVVAKREKTRANTACDARLPAAQIAQDVVLSAAVAFLARTGLSVGTIIRRLRIIAETIERGGRIPPAHSDEFELFVNVSSVLHDWVRSPDYTDTDGEPRALSLRGRRGLSALIRKRIPTRRTTEILRWMTLRKFTKRRLDGRYVLLKRAVLVGRPGPLQLETAANFAALYLEAAAENWEETDQSARHFDRIARVFHLPEKEVPVFREFVKRRATSWLEEMDNWLEDHDEPGQRRRMQAGVHVFGYVVGR